MRKLFLLLPCLFLAFPVLAQLTFYEISGNVSSSGVPIESAFVQVYNAAGQGITGAYTDGDGNYSVSLGQIGNDANGDYYVHTQEYFLPDPNLIPEVWNNKPCNPCIPWQDGDAVVVDGGDRTGINFDLEMADLRSISGYVTDEVDGSPLQGVRVNAERQSDSTYITGDTTDATGFYYMGGIVPQDGVVVSTTNLNGLPYLREIYNDKTPWWNESIGDPLDLTSADAEANFALARVASISGTVTHSVNDTPITNLELSIDTCPQSNGHSVYTDSFGQYSIDDIGTGVYYIHAVGNGVGYLNLVYPNYKFVYAPFDLCSELTDHPDVQGVVAVSGEPKIGVDFSLDPGSSISGTISDQDGLLPAFDDPQNPTAAGLARLYDTNGNLLQHVWTYPDPSFYFGGLLPGSYHVLYSSNALGLVDERHDNVACPRNSCNLELGVPIPVGQPDELAGHVTGIDGQLEKGTIVSGQITDEETGLPVSTYGSSLFRGVFFYTSDGNYAGWASIIGDGYFESRAALSEGDYVMSTQNTQFIYSPLDVGGGYVPQVWTSDGSFRSCGEPCDPKLGDLFYVNGVTPKTSMNLAVRKGGSITGSVATDSGTVPLAAYVRLVNSENGSLTREVFTDNDGNYLIDGILPGSYYIRTRNLSGYEDLLYGGAGGNVSCNPFCDVLRYGEPVAVSGTGSTTINFDLAVLPSISGHVANDLGQSTAGVTVEAYNTLGAKVATAISDTEGNYLLKDLWAGIFYIRTKNSFGYADVLYDSQTCPTGCEPTVGDGIALASGENLPGINLQMGIAGSITGTVTDGLDEISGIPMELYLDSGALIASTITNGLGAYSFAGLTAGNYHVISRNDFGYVDEGAGGGVCQGACLPTSTAVVQVSNGADVIANFVLDLGGEIEGKVIDDDLLPASNVTITAFNEAGIQVASTVTDSSGTYRLIGLANGNTFLRTFNADPLRNQRYDGLVCDAVCDVTAGTPVPTTVGTTVGPIDYSLETGYSISGKVKDSGATGIGGVLVEAYDAEAFAGSATSVAGGGYEIAGLAAGDYQLKTTNTLGYTDRMRGGDYCTPEPCVISSGATVSIVDADLPAIDISLVAGSPITGVATDIESNPLPTGSALLHSASGSYLQTSDIVDGVFNFTGIADGTYYMLVKNEHGLIDQLWQNIPCSGCDVTTGVAIAVGTVSAPEAVSRLEASGKTASKTLAITSTHNHLQFKMTTGTTIRGSVHTELGNPVQFAKVYIFDSTGAVAGEGTTDGIGEYETDSGFPNGTWYAATQHAGVEGVGGGLQDELYMDIPCTSDCDPIAQSATPIVIEAGMLGRVDFVLGDGAIPPDISSKADVDESATIGSAVQIRQGVVVHANVVIGAYSIINRFAEIGERCELGQSVIVEQGVVLGDNCFVGDGSLIGKSAVLSSDVSIGSDTIIGKDSAIGKGAFIGNNVELGPNVTVGEGVVVPDGTVVKKNTTL